MSVVQAFDFGDELAGGDAVDVEVGFFEGVFVDVAEQALVAEILGDVGDPLQVGVDGVAGGLCSGWPGSRETVTNSV